MRFVLMCQVLDGEPPIQVKWFKDNTDLAASLLDAAGVGPSAGTGGNQDNSAGSSISGGGEGGRASSKHEPGGLAAAHLDQIEMISNDELGSSLLFRRVRQQHGGNYTCLASNHFGSASYSSLMTVKGE